MTGDRLANSPYSRAAGSWRTPPEGPAHRGSRCSRLTACPATALTAEAPARWVGPRLADERDGVSDRPVATRPVRGLRARCATRNICHRRLRVKSATSLFPGELPSSTDQQLLGLLMLGRGLVASAGTQLQPGSCHLDGPPWLAHPERVIVPRRLIVMFTHLVGSTAFSSRLLRLPNHAARGGSRQARPYPGRCACWSTHALATARIRIEALHAQRRPQERRQVLANEAYQFADRPAALIRLPRLPQPVPRHVLLHLVRSPPTA